jgi:hypothetical protein
MRQTQKSGKRSPGFVPMNTSISEETYYFHPQGRSLPLLQRRLKEEVPQKPWYPFPKLPSITSQKLAVFGYREVHRWLTRVPSEGTMTATAGLKLSKS